MQKDKGILPKISAIFLGITDVFSRIPILLFLRILPLQSKKGKEMFTP